MSFTLAAHRWTLVIGLSHLLGAHSAWALDPAELFEKLSPSVWVVVVSDRNGIRMGSGSGVVIGPERLVTNCHVLRRASAIVVKRDNTGHTAKLEHADVERDLCTLSVKNMNAPAVAIAPLSSAKVGAKIITIGAPRGLELTLSDGLISSLRRDKNDEIESIQISAPISPGSSGGGLFNTKGELLGLPTWLLRDSQNLNFAVPAEWINEVAVRSEAQLAKARERREQTTLKQNQGVFVARQVMGAELVTLVKRVMNLGADDARYFEGSAIIEVSPSAERGISLILPKWDANARFVFKEASQEVCITAAFPPSQAAASVWRSFLNCYGLFEYEPNKFSLREHNAQTNTFVLK